MKVNDGLVKVEGIWTFEQYRDGELIWTETGKNLVVDEGLAYLVGTGLAGVAQIDPWYVGLYNTNRTVLADDTIADYYSIEVVDYDVPTRPQYNGVLVSSPAASVNNTASKAEYTFTAGGTAYGAFLVSTNTKGVNNGTVFAAKAFTSGARAYLLDDVIRVSYTVSIANA